jgi:hypothetical protein
MSGKDPSSSTSKPLPALTAAHWQMLSPQSTAILRQVISPVTLEGCSQPETAKRLGISRLSVPLLVDFFKNELNELEQNEPQPDS